MLCLKRHHLVLTLSLLALFAVPFLCSSGSVSALSYTYNIDDSNSSSTYDLCDNNSRSCSSYNYAVIESTQLDNSVNRFQLPYLNFGFTGNLSYSFRIDLISDYHVISLDFLNSNSDTYVFRFNGLTYSANMPSGYSISITLYDSLPSDCDPCPDCPPIPETPYGDILNKIYIAILAVSATALCIYFFYAFYNMFFGGIKR